MAVVWKLYEIYDAELYVTWNAMVCFLWLNCNDVTAFTCTQSGTLRSINACVLLQDEHPYPVLFTDSNNITRSEYVTT